MKKPNLQSKFKKTFFLILPLILISFVFKPSQIKAQNISLGIYPPLLEAMIQPGKSITQVYRLENQGETDLALTSQIIPFKPQGELGQVELTPEQNSPAQEWISFQNADLKLGEKFLLKAGASQQIVLRVDIPQNAAEDDYYLTLLFKNLPELMVNQSASQSQIKIGGHLLLTVSETGEPPRKAEISEFKITNAWFSLGHWQLIDSFASPLFNLRVKNIGRSLFKPMGVIQVSGWTGQPFVLDLLPENILVGSIRQVQCFSPEQNQPIVCQLKKNWQSKLLIGPFQAQVSFGLDKVDEQYSQAVSFFAFPFVLLGGLLVLFLLFWLGKKVKGYLGSK